MKVKDVQLRRQQHCPTCYLNVYITREGRRAIDDEGSRSIAPDDLESISTCSRLWWVRHHEGEWTAWKIKQTLTIRFFVHPLVYWITIQQYKIANT